MTLYNQGRAFDSFVFDSNFRLLAGNMGFLKIGPDDFRLSNEVFVDRMLSSEPVSYAFGQYALWRKLKPLTVK